MSGTPKPRISQIPDLREVDKERIARRLAGNKPEWSINLIAYRDFSKTDDPYSSMSVHTLDIFPATRMQIVSPDDTAMSGFLQVCADYWYGYKWDRDSLERIVNSVLVEKRGLANAEYYKEWSITKIMGAENLPDEIAPIVMAKYEKDMEKATDFEESGDLTAIEG